MEKEKKKIEENVGKAGDFFFEMDERQTGRGGRKGERKKGTSLMHTYLHPCTKIEKREMKEKEMKLTVNDGLDVGALAAEDNSLVDKGALATAPVILLEGRHGRLVKFLTLLDLLLDCLFLG